jgi:hypothetical protein
MADDAAIESHKKFAVELFNKAWELHDLPNRTKDQDDEMIQAAYASAWHWLQLKGHVDDLAWRQSTPRSHNQLANMYIALKRAEPAMYHANRCVEICLERGIGDFDIAFGYECLARAHNIAGNAVDRDNNVKLATEAGKAIAKKEDRDFFFGELKKVPGYKE